MNIAYLLIGGNIGQRELYLSKAREAINVSCGTITRQSPIYETEAWGKEDQQKFLNQALELSTRLSAHELLSCLLQTEEELGRKREVKYGPRTIDIDILLYNAEIIHTANLVIPHPQLPFRRFALQPLNDIASDSVHPELLKPIKQVLAECTDPLTVNKIS